MIASYTFFDIHPYDGAMYFNDQPQIVKGKVVSRYTAMCPQCGTMYSEPYKNCTIMCPHCGKTMTPRHIYLITGKQGTFIVPLQAKIELEICLPEIGRADLWLRFSKWMVITRDKDGLLDFMIKDAVTDTAPTVQLFVDGSNLIVAQGSYGNDAVDILDDPDWPKSTIFKYLTTALPNLEISQVSSIIKKWYAVIHDQQQTRFGRQIPMAALHVGSPVTSPKAYPYGHFFNMLQNIGWHIQFPDAPDFIGLNWMALKRARLFAFGRYRDIARIQQAAKTGSVPDFYTALCQAVKMPKTKTVMRLLHNVGLFNDWAVTDAYLAFIPQNRDHAYTLACFLSGSIQTGGNALFAQKRWQDWAINHFCGHVIKFGGGPEVLMRYINNVPNAIFEDCARMFVTLYAPGINRLKAKHPRSRDLHKTLVYLVNAQKYPYVKFKEPPKYAPAAITDQSYVVVRAGENTRSALLGISRADDTAALGRIADALHNCVRSYADKIQKGTCLIYYAYDEQTHNILACIELQPRGQHRYGLAQIKGFRNLPVADNLIWRMVHEWRERYNIDDPYSLEPAKEDKP